MSEELHKRLDEYIRSGALPMHMPGHKRNPAFTDTPGDITEIEGFDNLHSPQGIIRDIETKASGIYGAADAFISVNGATGLIFAAIHAATFRGEKILVASNCHISVWHAIETSGLIPVIIDPETDEDTGAFGKVSPEALEEALKAGDINTAVITTPTYEGVISDTEKLYGICRRYGCTLIADESHGAHFGVCGNTKFPSSAHADMVIKSLHKTMASPTQTAVMLIYGDLPFKDLIRHYLAVSTSTSPSYILMSGISSALTHTDTDAFFDIVSEGRSALSALKKLRLYDKADTDPSKFVILTDGYISGYELSDRLREGYGIEVEASFPAYIIAMTGIGDTRDSLKRFTGALIDIDRSLGERSEGPVNISYPAGKDRRFMLGIEDAVRSERALVSADKAEGRMSAEYLFAYPPGIPVLIPGEVITEDALKAIRDASHIKTDPFRDYDGSLFTVDI